MQKQYVYTEVKLNNTFLSQFYLNIFNIHTVQQKITKHSQNHGLYDFIKSYLLCEPSQSMPDPSHDT